MAHDVFISYANEDKAVANAICAGLEERDIRCWIAPRDVTPGVYYAQAIIEAIKESRVMALVFSSYANNSEHVVREAEQAVRAGIPIIPFRIDSSSPAETLNYYIGPQHWLDAAEPPFEAHVRRLAAAIELRLKTSAERLASAEASSGPSGTRALGTLAPPESGPELSASEESESGPKPRTQTDLIQLKRPRSHIVAGMLAAAMIVVVLAAGFAFFNPLNPSTPPATTQPDVSSESPHVLGAGILVLNASDYASPNSALNKGDTITIQLYQSGTYQKTDKTGPIAGQYVYYPPYQPKGQNTYRLFLNDPNWALIEMQPNGGFSWYANKTTTPLYSGTYYWSTPFQSA